MPDPLIIFIIATIITAILAFTFWPDKGLLARWKNIRYTNIRVLIEDALKHIYMCERNKVSCTFESIAGALSITTDRVMRILTRLEKLNLLERNGTDFILTQSGKTYALRIIRVHRLWERYLAEETSIPESRWHTEADIKEHEFSVEEANAISHRLGHPRYDPHGDPIPTSSGYLPPRRGIPLPKLKEGEYAKVIHIEDEPESIYSEIINKGVSLGMQIKIFKIFKHEIHFLLNGKETILTPFIATNITVLPLKKDEMLEGPYQNLLSLRSGEKAEVVSISRACRGQQRRRLLDLGLVPGTTITKEMHSITGDPIAYNIRGAVIALRNDQAKHINIKAIREAL